MQALETWVPAARLSLKWPNDVLLDSTKVAGILLEGQGGATIIGLGVNLAAHPADSERPAISLAGAGIAPPAPAQFVARLAACLTDVRGHWQAGGFAAIRSLWLAHAAGLGQPLIARLGTETLHGSFEGLAEDGALQLRLQTGMLRMVYAGEVFAGV